MSMIVNVRNADFNVRKMTQNDLDQMMILECDVYEFPWERRIFESCLRVNYTNVVYEINREIIGYGVMSMAAGEAHIMNLCIHSNWQSQGLGRRLLKYLIGQAGRINTDTIFLEVRETNRQAIGLYESAGFNEIGRRYDYYPAKKGKEDALVLALSL